MGMPNTQQEKIKSTRSAKCIYFSAILPKRMTAATNNIAFKKSKFFMSLSNFSIRTTPFYFLLQTLFHCLELTADSVNDRFFILFSFGRTIFCSGLGDLMKSFPKLISEKNYRRIFYEPRNIQF